MRKRLLGIDLFRGISAYAVILVHSGDATWGLPIEPAAENFRLLFYFAVPFFLATSFYLMVNRAKIQISSKFWLSRIERILIPYTIWTIIYLILKLAIFPLTNQSEQIASTLKDMWGIIFFGAASYHLYFLPLLFTGSFLVYFAKGLQQKHLSLRNLWLLFLFSIVGYQILIWSGNSFTLGSNLAFVPLLQFLDSNSISYIIVRTIFVWLAWMIRCLPYLLASMIYVKLNLNWLEFPRKILLLFWFAAFASINTMGNKIIPLAFWEILISFSMLIIALILSEYIKAERLIINLGQCSFGIYLIHPLIKSTIEILLTIFYPSITQSVSIYSIFFYSSLTFVVSWLVVFIGIKNKIIAKYMFGA